MTDKPLAQFLRRCFDLARLGGGKVSPNPMVGAVLVFEQRIIGEGFHQRYGGPHAEVQAVRSVKPADRPLIAQSTLYVSLEPCCIHGRTPPCTDLIIDQGIPRVVIANLDQSPAVNGLGVQNLTAAGVEVQTGLLEAEGQPFCKIRNTFVGKDRPYILLKYARSADGFLGPEDRPLWMTNEVSRRLAHKWRSETDAILAGPKTLLMDNPSLTNRFFPGKSPVRLVLDKNGELPLTLRVFDGMAPTWIFTGKPDRYGEMKEKARIFATSLQGRELIDLVLKSLAGEGLSSLMVEGGRGMLNLFLEMDLWDEARVFVAPLRLGKGLEAPRLAGEPVFDRLVLSDRLLIWERENALR